MSRTSSGLFVVIMICHLVCAAALCYAAQVNEPGLMFWVMHTGVTVTAAYFGAVDTSLYKLSDNHRKLARGLGVMITPQKAVEKALKAMFEGKSSCMPGFLNRIALPFLNLSERTLYRLLYKYGGRLS